MGDEFGGWAKITCSDAAELARIVGMFSRRTCEERTHMLLVLFASQSRDGTVNIGFRTLAERADVTPDKARRFMEWLRREGVLVDAYKAKNKGGEFTVDDVVCVVKTADGDRELTLAQKWPVRRGRPYAKKLPPDMPLIVPGEIYTEEKISEIGEWIERGFSVMGVDV